MAFLQRIYRLSLMKTETNKNLAQVAELLIKNKLTVAFAESCTAGLLQHIFSLAEDAMMIFQGGMTVYNSGQKAKHLYINPVFAEQCNSVSKEIAEKMAFEIAKKFNAEMGIAITGYAQPVPEDGIERSFAYIAVTLHGKTVLSKKIYGKENLGLAANQQIYADKILLELINLLGK